MSFLSEDNKIIKEKMNNPDNMVELFECDNKLCSSTTRDHNIISKLINRQIRANNILIFNLSENKLKRMIFLIKH